MTVTLKERDRDSVPITATVLPVQSNGPEWQTVRQEDGLGTQDVPTLKIPRNHLKTVGNSKRTVHNQWLATTQSIYPQKWGEMPLPQQKASQTPLHWPVSRTHLCAGGPMG